MAKKLRDKWIIEDALIIDARSLVNPYEEYPSVNGLHEDVQLFICRQPGFTKILNSVIHQVLNSLKDNIVFFCDGGQHRSPLLADIMSRIFSDSKTIHLSLKEQTLPISISSKDLKEFMWY
jgi:hypothetical protein